MAGTQEVFLQTIAKYEEERQKRLRPEGIAQFAGATRIEEFKHFAKDPWAGNDNLYVTQKAPVLNNGHVKVLITGAGYGSLLVAARLIEKAGFKADDFVFVDSAWGFGGTWYWNRYPGLMCDVESSCYLPLLEETGFIPKNRYSYGPELRAYAELVAEKWGFKSRALFGTITKDTHWDSVTSEWITTATREFPDGKQESWTIRSDFFVLASGLLNRPKVPRLEGFSIFKGHVFHTSRWDYTYTGGSPEDWTLGKLREKRVAFIGTGATGIQVVPQLGKWAGQLYVFQRTPSAVDVRGQQPITPEKWNQEIAVGKGWQRERRENMSAFISNVPNTPAQQLVDDGWTHFPSFSGLVGSPKAANLTIETVADYVKALHLLDFPRQERIRARVDEVVKDQSTASALKPWYPGWCKRPCFHDDYLDAFNLPNVKLVDTDGRGVDGFSENGVLFNGKEYEVDVVILGTGFESYSVGSPAYRSGISITGRDGLAFDDKWTQEGGSTLHGIFKRGFPNLLLCGVNGTGVTVNIVHSIDVLAEHAGYIINELTARSTQAEDSAKRTIIEPTAEAEEAWVHQILARVFAYAGLRGCTPNYANAEGAQPESQEKQIIAAKSAPWGSGINDYIEFIKAWEVKGDLGEFDVKVV